MLAVAVDLRNSLERVRDQGRRPTCLAFAASAVHRVAHVHPTELSPEWLYYHATRRDGLQPDEGSTVGATCASISHDGQPDETFWPYEDLKGNPQPYKPPNSRPSVVCCDTGLRTGNAAHWRTELDSDLPVAITVFISSSFYKPVGFDSREAIMADDQIPIDPALVHAVVLAGHGERQGVPYFLVRNSWGSRWGCDGHAWFPESYLARRFAGAFVIQHGASDNVQSDDTRTYSRLRVGSSSAPA